MNFLQRWWYGAFINWYSLNNRAELAKQDLSLAHTILTGNSDSTTAVVSEGKNKKKIKVVFTSEQYQAIHNAHKGNEDYRPTNFNMLYNRLGNVPDIQYEILSGLEINEAVREETFTFKKTKEKTPQKPQPKTTEERGFTPEFVEEKLFQLSKKLYANFLQGEGKQKWYNCFFSKKDAKFDLLKNLTTAELVQLAIYSAENAPKNRSEFVECAKKNVDFAIELAKNNFDVFTPKQWVNIFNTHTSVKDRENFQLIAALRPNLDKFGEDFILNKLVLFIQACDDPLKQEDIQFFADILQRKNLSPQELFQLVEAKQGFGQKQESKCVYDEDTPEDNKVVYQDAPKAKEILRIFAEMKKSIVEHIAQEKITNVKPWQIESIIKNDIKEALALFAPKNKIALNILNFDTVIEYVTFYASANADKETYEKLKALAREYIIAAVNKKPAKVDELLCVCEKSDINPLPLKTAISTIFSSTKKDENDKLKIRLLKLRINAWNEVKTGKRSFGLPNWIKVLWIELALLGDEEAIRKVLASDSGFKLRTEENQKIIAKAKEKYIKIDFVEDEFISVEKAYPFNLAQQSKEGLLCVFDTPRQLEILTFPEFNLLIEEWNDSLKIDEKYLSCCDTLELSREDLTSAFRDSSKMEDFKITLNAMNTKYNINTGLEKNTVKFRAVKQLFTCLKNTETSKQKIITFKMQACFLQAHAKDVGFDNKVKSNDINVFQIAMDDREAAKIIGETEELFELLTSEQITALKVKYPPKASNENNINYLSEEVVLKELKNDHSEGQNTSREAQSSTKEEKNKSKNVISNILTTVGKFKLTGKKVDVMKKENAKITSTQDRSPSPVRNSDKN